MPETTNAKSSDRSAFAQGHELGSDPVPVDRYYSDDFFELEKEAIWKDSWLWVGRAGDISKPGDFFVFEFGLLHSAIIVVRGKDGKVRGFHNFCKHRGSPVVFDREGSKKNFTCAFHGWVYDLEGRLVNVPQEDQYANFDKSCLGLKEVALDIWGGWIFINYNPKPEHSLHEWMKPLPSALEEYFANENWYWRSGYKDIFKCNWKILIDNQIEGYHVNSLHQATVKGFFLSAGYANSGIPRESWGPGQTRMVHAVGPGRQDQLNKRCGACDEIRQD